MISIRTIAVIVAFCAGLAVGGGAVRYAWQSERLKTSQAQAKQLKELNEAKDEAISARDTALADLHNRNRDNAVLVERLRKQSSPVSDHPIGTCQRHLSECRDLLAEGAGLLNEGGELVGKLNADRTAVRRLTQHR